MIGAIRSMLKKEAPALTPAQELMRAYNDTRPSRPHTFCKAPSVNMYFAQDGNVKVCCNNFFYSIGKYPEQKLQEIWNGEAAKKLQEKMRQNDLSAGCSVCEYDLKRRNFGEVRARFFDDMPVHSNYPTMMEFLLTNTCNLECIMCRGENSSLIRKNREKLPPIISPYGKDFIKELEPFIPYLQETRFSGSGEAFAIDMYYEIWEMIIARNPACRIVVQTNGTILNARVKAMLERGNFEIGVSVDAVSKQNYEAIRVNAQYEKVMENVRYLSNYSRRHNKPFFLSACVMRRNWRELPGLVEFCNEMNAVATLHKVWSPWEEALFNLPANELADIHNYLSSAVLPDSSPLERSNKEHYHYFVSVIKDWLDDAPRLQHEHAMVNGMDEHALTGYLYNKFEAQIGQGKENSSEQEATILLCKQKLEELLLLCDTELTKEKVLRWLSLLPDHEMIGGFKLLPVDFIYSEARRYLL